MQKIEPKLPLVVWVSLCGFRGWKTDNIFKFQLYPLIACRQSYNYGEE